MATLALEKVSRRFGEVTAVEGVSLEVAEGEFVVLVGPSGCGKTTTLRLVAGLEEVSAGRVRVAGEDVTDMPAKDRRLAMVFQSYALYPHMTVGETIGFALRLEGRSRSEIETAVRAAADRLEIGHLLDRKPRALSGGQRQRVAVARCIVRQPRAFLFDEPLSNLDAKLRASARVEISKLQKSLGTTSVYVTHDQIEAMTMADRIVLMEGGRIRQVGPPMELYRAPADLFVAAFLGAPPMNLLPGRVAGGRFAAGAALSVALGGGAPVPDGPATLGIRPEALSPDPAAGPELLRGHATHVEQLGAETIVEVEMRNAAGLPAVTVRLPGDRGIQPGTPLALHAPAGALHFFDGGGARVARAFAT